MNDITTTDLSQFGLREIELLRDLLDSWLKDGLPLSFNETGIHPMFNRNSGSVFLTNEEYQVCMIDPYDNKLSMFHSCPECGQEGFDYDMRGDHGKDCCSAYLDELLEDYSK